MNDKQPGITIIGLGPGPAEQWTGAAADRLAQADELYLRTAHHASVAEISAPTANFDDYRSLEQIAAEVIRLGKRGQGVIYAVPGHPAVDEATVPLIRAGAEASNLPLTIIPGLSLLADALAAFELENRPALQISDALALAARYHPPLEPDRPALITNLHCRLAAPVQQTLLNAYRPGLPIRLAQPAGQVWRCRLAELSRQPLNGLTTLYLPDQADTGSLSALQEIVAHLRGPEGCPWDRKQTLRTLRPYLLEETYEALETIDANDPAALAEELGDLLLIITLITQVAIEQGHFQMSDIIGHINRKMVRRHPHVFSDTVVEGVEDIIRNWEQIKKEEKGDSKTASALAGVPSALPALAQALLISKKAVQVGFEWPNMEGVLDKLVEEAREVAEATDPAHLEMEIGDLLFVTVNLARWCNIEPESALRATNARFMRRFQKVEELAAAQGKQLPDMPLAEMEALWQEAKRYEK